MRRTTTSGDARTRHKPIKLPARVVPGVSFCYNYQHMNGAQAPHVERLLVWKTGKLRRGETLNAGMPCNLAFPVCVSLSGIPVASDENHTGDALSLSRINGRREE